MPTIRGFDISNYEPVVQWGLIRAQGFKFVIIKATEGMHYVDPSFALHWKKARQYGILRGAYHYLRAGQDGVRQGRHFLKTVPYEEGDLPPFLDIEEANNTDKEDWDFFSSAQSFLQFVEAETGRTPIIYSRADILYKRLSVNGKPPPWAMKYPLWVANYLYKYKEGDEPVQAKGWQPWTFWQYTNRGQDLGIKGIYNINGEAPDDIDLNWFRGTQEELNSLAGIHIETMHTFKEGETLTGISRRYKVSLARLLSVNPTHIFPGTELYIPSPLHPAGKTLPGSVESESDRVAREYLESVVDILDMNPSLMEPVRSTRKRNAIPR